MTGPAGHFSTGNTPAPFINSAMIGTPYGAPGISAVFLSCQEDTVWLFAVDCMAGSVEPGVYSIVENDNSSFCGIATCEEPGRPLCDATTYNSFCYNKSDDSTEESTWGAIKIQF